VCGELHFQVPLYGQKLTTKFFTSGKGTAELKLDDLGVRGLNMTLLGGIGKDVGVGTVEFKHGPIGITAAVDYFGRAGDASIAAAYAPKGYSGFGVIGLVGKVSSEFAREKLDLCLSYYDGEESECTLHVNDKATRGLMSYSHHVRPGFSVAGQFLYDQPKESSVLTMGCAARLDNCTVVKGKVDSRGEVSASYIQEIRAKTKLILSTKFDVSTLDSAKVGISLALE
jgi:Eukaryotic porin